MLTEDERSICSALGISEAEFQSHRRGGSARISLNNARGTGTIAATLDSARQFVEEAGKNRSPDLGKQAALARRLHRDLGAMLGAASVGSDDGEESAKMILRDEKGNGMVALPIRG